ncbi:MAG: DUF547 domain-containing protein [Bacteroidota bacterium]
MKYLFLLSFTFLLACTNSTVPSNEVDSDSDIVEATITTEISRAQEPVEEAKDREQLQKELSPAEPEVLLAKKTADEKKNQRTSVKSREKKEKQKEVTPITSVDVTKAKQSAKTVAPEKQSPEVPTNITSSPQSEPSTKPNHDAWDAIAKTYISSSGVVNYTGLKGKEATLDAYLDDLANQSPTADWGRNEIMAYWINAYNAFTVKLILKNWPVKSIMDLHGGKAWDVKWITLGGKSYSLNNIEHDILRKRYPDPRIHFAVNCAAQSCPPIHNRAFTASNLKSTLERLAKNFINNNKYNTITVDEAKVSKIFEWYASDFGDLKAYLNKYSNATLVETATIGFQEYDWALNGK